jgi:hypothetical protein
VGLLQPRPSLKQIEHSSAAPVAESSVSGTLTISGTIVFPLKGHGNEPDFPRFLH